MSDDNTLPFAMRSAAFLADIKESLELGLALDPARLAQLAQLHDVPEVQRSPAVINAIETAEANLERQRLEGAERKAKAKAEIVENARAFDSSIASYRNLGFVVDHAFVVAHARGFGLILPPDLVDQIVADPRLPPLANVPADPRTDEERARTRLSIAEGLGSQGKPPPPASWGSAPLAAWVSARTHRRT